MLAIRVDVVVSSIKRRCIVHAGFHALGTFMAFFVSVDDDGSGVDGTSTLHDAFWVSHDRETSELLNDQNDCFNELTFSQVLSAALFSKSGAYST